MYTTGIRMGDYFEYMCFEVESQVKVPQLESVQVSDTTSLERVFVGEVQFTQPKRTK